MRGGLVRGREPGRLGRVAHATSWGCEILEESGEKRYGIGILGDRRDGCDI